MHISDVWLVTLVQEHPQHYRLAGPARLRIDQALPEPARREALARELLDRLLGEVRDEAA